MFSHSCDMVGETIESFSAASKLGGSESRMVLERNSTSSKLHHTTMPDSMNMTRTF